MTDPFVQNDPQATARQAKVAWRAVGVFLLVAFGLAWLVALPMWVGGGLKNPFAGALLVGIMFTPAIAALSVVFVQKPRPRSVVVSLGMWPLRPLKRTIGMIALAIFGSIAIVIAGVLLAAALRLVQLDLVTFSGLAVQLTALSQQQLPIPIQALVVAQLLALPVGAVINGIFTLGEELGWRGWLLPNLLPLGTWPALLITGAIWGLWHAPIILLGYNFAQPNLFGVALMVVGTTLYGVIVGWLRLRSASLWPAVFAHGAFNAAGGFVLLVASANSPLDLVALNPLGWVTWIVIALVIVVLIATGQFKRTALPT